MKPEVSIITVCFNDLISVEKTCQSILHQDFCNFEYLIIDGDSTDGTKEYLQTIADKRVRFISEPDNGIYDAMNKGIHRASGEWINFMNAGDTFAENTTLSQIFDKNKVKKDTDVIYGDCICVTSTCEGYGKSTKPFWIDKSIVPGKGFSHQSSFVRTNIAKEMPFCLNYRICADFDMMWKIYSKGGKFQYIPIPIAKYEVESGFSKQHPCIAYCENAHIVGVDKTIKFKISYICFKIKVILHDVLSKLVKKTCPRLFYFIKRKHISS